MILLAAAAIVSAACQKEAQAPQETTSKATVEKTFTVTMPQDETKTYLDGMSVKWSDNDEINVIAATSGNQYTFTIASGQNTITATFTGTLDEADASETTFYAVYPNRQIRITGDSNNRDLEHGVITLEAISTAQEAVLDAYDPQFAVMTAKTDAASATMDFRHGVAYFKIKVGIDNVNKIKISTDGSARFNGRPCLDAETGAPVNVDGAKNFVEIAPKSGDFVNGGTYFVPVTIKNSALKNLTITYSFSDGSADASITTGKKSSEILEPGKIYDLGCPPITVTPAITAADVTLESDATYGEILYTIVNEKATGQLTAALKETSDWLTVSNVTSGVVELTSLVNTGASRTATVTLTYTYDTTETVTKDVVVTQKAPGTTESHEYVFYYNTSGSAVNLKDGVADTYFTASAKADLGGDYAISSWDINGYTSSKGVKLNSSGYVSFTTSTTLKSTVQFWFIRRKSGDTSAQIQLVPEGGTAQVFDSPHDNYATSGVINLEKGTAYTIKQASKEQALLLVIVNETE